jgi:aerotaxis receptor
MNKVTPIDEEYIYSGSAIISQTDLDGVITYANKAFCEASGYKSDELVGKLHNIIRHPDMPKIVFAKMWETIKGGQAWNGLVKNLRSDGRYYWVETEILPIVDIVDDEETITGFIAVRKEASQKDISETIQTYTKMLETQE